MAIDSATLPVPELKILWNTATIVWPEVQTRIAKNERPMNKLTADPRYRPVTPKNAPPETALFVPVLGDWMATPAKMIEPTITPIVIAVTVLHQLSPNAMPSEP